MMFKVNECKKLWWRLGKNHFHVIMSKYINDHKKARFLLVPII